MSEVYLTGGLASHDWVAMNDVLPWQRGTVHRLNRRDTTLCPAGHPRQQS